MCAIGKAESSIDFMLSQNTMANMNKHHYPY